MDGGNGDLGVVGHDADDVRGAAGGRHVHRHGDRRRAPDDLERVVDTDTGEPAHGLDRVDVRRVDEIGRAESTGERQLLRIGVDRHDPGRTGDASALDHVEPDAAAPDHGDRVAGLDMGDVEHRAQAGDHGAAEDRRQLDRHVARYRDHAPFVHQHPLGEPTDPTHRGDRRGRRGGEPGAFAGGPPDRLRLAALAGLAAMARRAPTASGQQAGDDPSRPPTPSSTAEPTASTTPAASWPSTCGRGRTSVPSSQWRSL